MKAIAELQCAVHQRTDTSDGIALAPAWRIPGSSAVPQVQNGPARVPPAPPKISRITAQLNGSLRPLGCSNENAASRSLLEAGCPGDGVGIPLHSENCQLP